MKKNILIIAGEPSGDMRAGELLTELKKLLPTASFWGIGGNNMENQGVELIEHIRQFSIIGVWEVIKNLFKIHRQYKHLMENVHKKKPHLAILIDYPGFNLRIAKFLYRNKIPVVYYIIPQVWAWGHGRMKLLKNFIDKIIVLFKFEENFLKQAGISSEFVGHPLIDEAPTLTKGEGRGMRDELTIALLPGSRKSEIQYMFPLMLHAAENIIKNRKKINFVVAENSNVDKNLYNLALANHENLNIARFTDNTLATLARSDFAIVTSGTATLETAIMEKPMIVTYRTSVFTSILFRLFTNVPLIGLVNIIAGKEIAPELLQKDATPEALSGKVLEIINDASRMQHMREGLKRVKHSLGEKGASRRAAEAIDRFIKERNL